MVDPDEADAGRIRRATITRMPDRVGDDHALVLYRSSDRADATLRELCRRTLRVTVVVLARHEPHRSGCCDTRSTLWNGICRDLAHEDLSKARRAVATVDSVDFGVLVAPERDAVGAVTREAVARGADEIVVADRRRSGLGRLELRRLRRSSPVPVQG